MHHRFCCCILSNIFESGVFKEQMSTRFSPTAMTIRCWPNSQGMVEGNRQSNWVQLGAVSSFQLPVSSFEFRASNFQFPASSFQFPVTNPQPPHCRTSQRPSKSPTPTTPGAICSPRRSKGAKGKKNAYALFVVSFVENRIGADGAREKLRISRMARIIWTG